MVYVAKLASYLEFFRKALLERPLGSSAAFELAYVFANENLLRVGFFLGAVLMLGFSYWDWIVDPENFRLTAAIRATVISPVLLLFAVCWRRLPGTAFAKVNVVSLTCLAGLNGIYYIQPRGYELSVTGNMMILVFIFVFVRLPFRQMVSLSVSAVTIYLVFGLAKAGVSSHLMVVHMMVVISTAFMGLIAVYGLQLGAERLYVTSAELAASKEKIESMLHDILPQRLVSRLIAGEQSIAEPLKDVSFMFVDIVGFTKLSNELTPEKLVEILNSFFGEFDSVIGRYGWEKIKTIGDGYMAIHKDSSLGNAQQVVNTCIDLFAAVAKSSARYQVPLRIRIGLNYGNAIGGVIGRTRHMYDCWGVAVNMASRLESTATPGAVNLSESAYQYLSEFLPECEVSEIELKGFGSTSVRTWFPLG
jgi:class 3 adenylate cyclase